MKSRIIILLLTFTLVLVVIGWYRDHEKLTEEITSVQKQQSLETQQDSEENPTNPYANMDLAVEALPSEENTWGYRITANGRTIISQTNIPGFPGNLGFNLEINALTTGEFVLGKIKKGEFPPTVSINELNHLGVID